MWCFLGTVTKEKRNNMGLRFRKSIKIAPGVKLNLGSKSAGISIGTKGCRYSLNTSGRRTTTVGLPGTGLYYSHSSSGAKKSESKKKSVSRSYTSTAYAQQFNSKNSRLNWKNYRQIN